MKEKVKVKIFFNKGRIERNVVKKKVGYTGGRFRSYVLWGVSHNHPQVVPSPRGGLVERERTVFNSALPLRHTGIKLDSVKNGPDEANFCKVSELK